MEIIEGMKNFNLNFLPRFLEKLTVKPIQLETFFFPHLSKGKEISIEENFAKDLTSRGNRKIRTLTITK